MKIAIRILAGAGLLCLAAAGAAAAAPGPRVEAFAKGAPTVPADYAGPAYRPALRGTVEGWRKAADARGPRLAEGGLRLSFTGSAAVAKAADASRRPPAGVWGSFSVLKKEATGLSPEARSLSGTPGASYQAGRVHGLAEQRPAAAGKERSFTIAVRRPAAASLEKLFESRSR